MNILTQHERETATRLAADAIRADSRGDHLTRDRAISELFGVAGYWQQSRTPSTAEYRGEAVPPKMLRMPSGRSVPWSRRWRAVEAWAAITD